MKIALWQKAACRIVFVKKVKKKKQEKAEEKKRADAYLPPPRSDWLVHPPSQRAFIGDVEHLVGVEQFAEAVQKVATFKATTPGVYKNQQGADIWGQLLHLHTVRSGHFRGSQESSLKVTRENLKK